MDRQDRHNHLENLVASYKDYFGITTGDLTLLEDQVRGREDVWSRKNFRGHLTASGFVFSEDHSRVLLIHHRRLDRWLQPGGHVDPGESLVECATREIQEETGLSKLVLHPFHQSTQLPCDVNSHFVPANQAKNEPDHFHHDFRYVFMVNGCVELQHDEEEVVDAKWVEWTKIADEMLGSETCGRVEELLRNPRRRP
jgi:8-oxo-dGTP pyrophosphatase MutT (NUDIX family)